MQSLELRPHRVPTNSTTCVTVPTQHATMSNDVLLACTIGDLPWLRQGLSKGIDPCTRTKEGLNGLHLAAKNGRVQCLRHLLDNCDIGVNSLATSSGGTALHHCISPRSGTKTLQCMKLLLDRGIDKNKQNTSGDTALHLASKIGHAKCLKALLECGADIHIADKDGLTAYNIACLHSQHECARLLRALHWANKKDISTSKRMREEALRQSRDKETKALHARLKEEAAGTAYDNWLDTANTGVHCPTECATRQETRTQTDRTITCTTCSQAATQHQSASTTHHRPKGAKPIKIVLHQEKRNIGSVGKPDKMYPYTNYPPEAVRSHKSSVCPAGKGSAVKLGSNRTSRPTSTITKGSAHVPAGVKYYCKLYRKWHHRTAAKVGSAAREVPSNADRGTAQVESESQVTQSIARVTPTEEMEESISSHALIVEENTNEIMFSREHVEGDHEESTSPDGLENDNMDMDDDFAFHDVGYANSLNALSLPCSLMKGRTPAEVVQLLRLFGSPGPKSHKHSHSYSQGTSRYKSLSQRRFSLGSIPEGKIVTSYSDEDASSTHLLNYHNLETLIQSYSKGTNRRRAWETDDDYNLEEDQLKEAMASGSEESLSPSDGSDDLFESSQRANDRDCSLQAQQLHTTCSDSMLLEKRKQADPPKLTSAFQSRRFPIRKSMAFVNLTWDSTSNTVQSQVTVSPMPTHDKHVKIHRPTPPGSRSTSPSESSSRSLSLYELRALSRSSSPRDPKMTPRSNSPMELMSPHTLRSSSPSMEYVHPALISSGISNPSSSSHQASSPLQAASSPSQRIPSPLPNPASSPTTSALFTSPVPRANSPVSTIEMQPDQPQSAPPLPKHSLFSMSSFASKSMILIPPETDHSQLMLQRTMSAPSTSAHVKRDKEISTIVLKPTIFEFRSTLKHS